MPEELIKELIQAIQAISKPHCTQVVSAFLVPIIAVFGIYIAYRQWRTAQNRLKMDLFDKRFSVYDAARKFLASVFVSGKVTDEELSKFTLGTGEAAWLLNDDIAGYFKEEIWKKALTLQVLQKVLEDLPKGEERTQKAQKKKELLKWFSDQHKVLDEKFSPFLKLRH